VADSSSYSTLYRYREQGAGYQVLHSPDPKIYPQRDVVGCGNWLCTHVHTVKLSSDHRWRDTWSATTTRRRPRRLHVADHGLLVAGCLQALHGHADKGRVIGLLRRQQTGSDATCPHVCYAPRRTEQNAMSACRERRLYTVNGHSQEFAAESCSAHAVACPLRQFHSFRCH